ncbi:AbrB family transcriptional regulator [Salinarimonas rosea]|uniref:AbrB family transcriptional regulator n=1 Tax=Salinarimonas rosea TaxID=552063 RepID=UPI000410A95B|nr:AbrB family transcriptional regulator [Salinarimonas rosea]
MTPRQRLEAYRSSPVAQVVQVAVAWGGGWLFTVLGVPASWLSGAVVAVILLGRFGLAVIMPRALAETAMVVSGAVIGAGMTPDTLAAVGRYPLSLLFLTAAVVATTFASSLVLMRGFGWQRDDAVLATVPGALTAVMAIAAERRADVAGIGIVQSTRLLFLIIVLPFLVAAGGGGGDAAAVVGAAPAPAPETAGAGTLAVVLLGGVVVGVGFERIGLAAPLLLGATLFSGVAYVSGTVAGPIPEAIATLGFVLIGVYIAQRFNTLDLAAIRRLVPAALTAFVVGMTVAGAFAGLAVAFAGAPLAEALVAFAPGGLEAMVVLALVMGLDPLYVGVHHFVRFLGIGFVLPVVFRSRGSAGSARAAPPGPAAPVRDRADGGAAPREPGDGPAA